MHNLPKIYTLLREVILPISLKPNHPLGPIGLHEYLIRFPTPYERDKIWSGPDFTEDKSSKHDNEYSNQHQRLKLIKDFQLRDSDSYNDKPLIYAWFLTSFDTIFRMNVKQELIKWAILKKINELLSLLDLTFNTNDPQMKEDLLHVLLDTCRIRLFFHPSESEIVRNWVIQNCFNEDSPKYTSVSIRNSCISILKICSSYCNIENYNAITTPLYSPLNELIDLDRGCLEQKGWYPIENDLQWYVAKYAYDDFLIGTEEQNEALNHFFLPYSKKYNKEITNTAFAYSAIVAKMKKWGWVSEGSSVYTQATHGGKSELQTTIEKYVWCGVHELYGFLADRLPLLMEQEKVHDYRIKFNFSDTSFIISNSYLKECPYVHANIVNTNFIETFPTLIDDIDEFDRELSKEWTSRECKIDWEAIIFAKPIKKNTYNDSLEINNVITTYAMISDLDLTGNGRAWISISACSIDKNDKDDFITEDFKFHDYEIESVSDIAASIKDLHNANVRDVYSDQLCEVDYHEIKVTAKSKEIRLTKLNLSFSNYNIKEGDTEFIVPIKDIFSKRSIISDGETCIDNELRCHAFYNQNRDSFSVFQKTLHIDKKTFEQYLSDDKDVIWFASVYKEVNPHILTSRMGIYARHRKIYIVWNDNGTFRNKMILENNYE